MARFRRAIHEFAAGWKRKLVDLPPSRGMTMLLGEGRAYDRTE
jgi:hypothetical protein